MAAVSSPPISLASSLRTLALVAVSSRRYSMEYPTTRTTMDGWLRSPALDNLQELLFCRNGLLLPSVHRFSPTLCVARFSECSFPIPGGNDAGPRLLNWPLLKKLTLFKVKISESSLHTLLAGCPVLESLLLLLSSSFSRLQIVSLSLRSFAVHSSYFHSGYIQ